MSREEANYYWGRKFLDNLAGDVDSDFLADLTSSTQSPIFRFPEHDPAGPVKWNPDPFTDRLPDRVRQPPPFPSQSDVRIPGFCLAEEFLEEMKKDNDSGDYTLAIKYAPVHILILLAKSLLSSWKTNPSEGREIRHTLVETIKYIPNGDCPSAACSFVQQVVLDIQEESLWHRQLLRVGFLRRPAAPDAKKFFRDIATEIQDRLSQVELDEAERNTPKGQDSQGPLVKITTIKLLAHMLREVDYMDREFAAEVLAGLLIRGDNAVPGIDFLDIFETHAIGIASSMNELSPTTEEESIDASRGGPLPVVYDQGIFGERREWNLGHLDPFLLFDLFANEPEFFTRANSEALKSYVWFNVKTPDEIKAANKAIQNPENLEVKESNTGSSTGCLSSTPWCPISPLQRRRKTSKNLAKDLPTPLIQRLILRVDSQRTERWQHDIPTGGPNGLPEHAWGTSSNSSSRRRRATTDSEVGDFDFDVGDSTQDVADLIDVPLGDGMAYHEEWLRFRSAVLDAVHRMPQVPGRHRSGVIAAAVAAKAFPSPM
ncbi:hypothetical protein F4778DRAFT_778024 [Xylariomycetidae sp. FL2044]|nr:hypothetical protein F4778DRAFT_778024 [Xylariomycetidae sp. FL2044]